MKKKTHEEYVEELKIKNPNIEVREHYINSQTPILHYCTIHKIQWKATPNNILMGKGCKECQKDKFKSAMTKTHQEYVNEVANTNPNIEVLENYINNRTPILHRCKIHDIKWLARPYDVLQEKGCWLCRNEKIGNALRKQQEVYEKEVTRVNPNIEVIGEYINSNTAILHKCKIDGTEWMVYPSNILRGEGCPLCKYNLLHQTFAKTHEQYIIDVSIINADIEVVGKYINSYTPILHRCKLDGHEWMARPYNILSGKGCPICIQSHGEKIVTNWLNSHNINYIPQYRFSDCRDKHTLPFDFYLCDYNICIEFDGGQHYFPVDFAGKGDEWSNEQFILRQIHDQIKTDYCQSHNILLLRIRYDEDIEEKLNSFIY